MRLLRPIRENRFEYEELEEIISQYFRETIYIPLLRVLESDDKLENSASDDKFLIRAIRTGRVRFWHGEFTGQLSSRITADLKRLGARWDRRTRTFKINLSELPSEVRSVIRVSEERFLKKNKQIFAILDKVESEKIYQLNQVQQFFDTKIFRLNEDINDTLGIKQSITKEQREIISKEYTENMSLYIKDFTEKEIVKLREKMEKNMFSGARYEEMIETIQKSYGVSKSKAKFLARQETALLSGSFKRQRYQEAGSDGYIWRCVHGTKESPVRPMHKALDSVFVSWDNPPVINERGDRRHAGEDFNCRCYPQPVVRF